MPKAVIFFMFISLFFTPGVSAAVVQTDQPLVTPTCKPIFGGGQYACEVTNTPTPTASRSTTKPPTATPSPTKVQTKGGLPVEKPSPTKTTPPTGAHALSLLGLLIAATTGIYLNKKTRRS